MEIAKKLAKKTLTIIVAIIALLLIGWCGQLDHDEYIEANSMPVSRMPFWYETISGRR